MKLFLISQEENNDYDTYDSAVVAAETEEEAQKMDPDNGGVYNFNRAWAFIWAFTLESVTVKYLGEATIGTEKGVICASFNAG